MMANPFSDGVLGILAFIKEHPGVQAKYITAELNIKGKDPEIALTIVQGRGLVDAKVDHMFNKLLHADNSPIRYFAKI